MVALVLVPIAVGCAIASFQLNSYVRRADTLEKRLAATSVSLNAEVAEFQTDFSAAGRLRTSLKALRAEHETVRAEAMVLGQPVLVPRARVDALTGALVDHADALVEYADILESSAEFATGRTKAFQEVADNLDKLRELSGEGVKVEDAERLAKDVRVAFDVAVAKMRAAPPSSPVLYSNARMLQQLEQISAPLAEIERAIVDRDQSRIERAFESYAVVTDVDWLVTLAAHDLEGLQAINSAARTAREASAAFEEARRPLESLQQPLLVAGLASTVVAALSALGALMLRSVVR